MKQLSIVMPGLDPGILFGHFNSLGEQRMAGSGPAMTSSGSER